MIFFPWLATDKQEARKIVEIFNIIAGVCSIIRLFLSVFVASKVVKLCNSNNNNMGEIQTGDGVQKIAKENSVIADGGSTYIDYREATIVGEIDEPPILTEHRYPVLSDENFSYRKSVNEICFVFFPEECIGEKGSVFITDVVITKDM